MEEHKPFIQALMSLYAIYHPGTELSNRADDVLVAYANMFPQEKDRIQKAWERAKQSNLRPQSLKVDAPAGDFFGEVMEASE